MRFTRAAAWLGATVIVSVGCGHADSCPTLEVTGSADGDLALVESRASQLRRAAFWGDELDAGLDVDAASTPRSTQSLASLQAIGGVSLAPSCDRVGDAVAPCVRLGPPEYLPPPPVLTFRLPDAPGRYALSDLAAKICGYAPTSDGDATAHCWPVDGDSVVRATAAPCADATCGTLDADLTIRAADRAPDGAYATGSAHLLYHVDTVDLQCSGGGGSFPMFGLN